MRPRAKYAVVHGELGPDHVLADADVNPVVIDIEGSMYFEIYDVNSPTPENQSFVRKFCKRYGRNPDAWAAQGYDALHILAKAVLATGSANPLDLSYAIRFMSPWEGANGRYQFDSRGELEDKAIFLHQFRNGSPVKVRASRLGPLPVTP